MPAPLIVLAHETDTLAPYLRARLPGEEIVALAGAEGLYAALAAGPEAAFLIQHVTIPQALHHRVRDCPTLGWLHVGGSGYEWLGAWDRGRLTVTNSTGVLAPHLAETVIGAIAAVNFGMPGYAADRALRRWQPGLFPPLAGQKLLIVGAGAIGREVATRARALGLEVTGLNRSGAAVDGIPEMRRIVEIDTILGGFDVVSCHLRLTPETRHFFDAARFARMKPGAIFMNSARGGCVDEAALAAALRDGRLRGAWCDVFETEPLPPASPLWELPTLFVSPHCADQIVGWELRFADLFVANLGRWRAGEPMINVLG